MTEEANLPTLKEIFDALIGLAKTTEAGFSRVTSEIVDLRAHVGRLESSQSSLRSDVSSLKSDVSSLRSDVLRIESRVARIEGWNLDRRFDALELRVARLEQTY